MANKEPLDLGKLTTRDFPLIRKLSREQEDMVIKLYKYQRVIVDSVAGSGKTTVLTQAMRTLMREGYVKKVYYVVFPTQEDELGFLPGDVADKITEYAIPFVQALREAGEQIDEFTLKMMCNELIETDYNVVPHTYLRGRTIKDAGIIIDEAQNGTVDQLKKVFTRLDDSNYISISGHNGQVDIENSGYSRYIHHFRQGKESGIYPDIEFATLTHNFRGKFSAFADQLK